MHKSHGFTLIELMVVLAIVAILTTIAAPSFKQLIQSITISSSVNTFLSDMRYARSEAVRRGGGVVMCRSDDPEATDPTCDSGSGPGSNGWISGWIIFHALDKGAVQASAETLLRVQSPITAIDSINEESGASTEFRFTATGRFLSLNPAPTLRFGSAAMFDDAVRRTVCFSLGGYARIAGDGSAQC
ncbi:MAG: prepilin-type N-terminal cleavage/methylation domain-containing protein [Oxalobacteraceae bacterium]|nr:prepilin-type N-terminal cleavage/methylation domain-containing protein [Oxalobacteraceae bacterium]